MSTRANIVIKGQDFNGKDNFITLYQHCDGYPSHIIPQLKKALSLSWKLPRFDYKDYAAAVVATFKEGPGGMYVEGSSPKERELLHGDINFWYLVSQADDLIFVEAFNADKADTVDGATIGFNQDTGDEDVLEGAKEMETALAKERF